MHLLKYLFNTAIICLFFIVPAIAQFENLTPNQKIRMAVIQGDIDAIKDALKNGADVNAKDQEGASLLILATGGFVNNDTKTEASEIVALLLNNGANVNAKDNMGKTALFVVCSGETLMLPAQQKIKIAELLINKGADKELIARTHGNDEGTALMYAGMIGDIEMVKLLINKGANVNAKNDNSKTPLMFVTNEANGLPIYNKVKIIELLLAKGANPNQKDQGGETAITMAEETSQTDVLKALRGQKVSVKEQTATKTDIEGITLPANGMLNIAIMEGNIEGVKEAIKNGADINVHADMLGSPLVGACTYLCAKNNYEIAELLIANGADVNYPVPYGPEEFNGALAYAVNTAGELYFAKKYTQGKVDRDYKDFIKIMELLLKKGAKPDGVKFKETNASPLKIAAWSGCLEAVQLLLKNGATVKDSNPGENALMLWASSVGGIGFAALRIDGAIGLKMGNKRGKELEETKKSIPKGDAYYAEYTEIVRLLISKGANVNVSYEGATPLRFAKALKITQMINLLQKAGAK